MNLYEFEGKNILEKYGIQSTKRILVGRGDDIETQYNKLGKKEVVVKAQILSGKRGKNNGIQFCSSLSEVQHAVNFLFSTSINHQYVASVLIEERIEYVEEHYLSITYNTLLQQPLLIYSTQGGMDIESVPEQSLVKQVLDVRSSNLSNDFPYAQELWNCFLEEDARIVEINPLVKTASGDWVALDAKLALDDDAFYRHPEWVDLEPRTILGRLPTERELAVKKIDEGEAYYRGTAGKYIELEGDIAVLFSGGGASLSNMDALNQVGLKAANYTEYSGNPPREKVYQLTKIVLSKPGLRGLWIAGGVANFTNIVETFHGIVDALEEIKPAYPIVVRRAGPFEKEGMELMDECAKRNNLTMKLFGKEVPMSETAGVLKEMIERSTVS